MKTLLPRSLLLALLLCVAAALPAAAAVREFRGMPFEEGVVQGNGTRLGLVGLTEVGRNYLPFYAASLYLPGNTSDPAQVSSGLMPCRIELRWLAASVPADIARAYWDDEFKRVLGSESALDALRPSINRFVVTTFAAQRGDSLLIDYDPELGMAVSRNGGAASRYAGIEFSRAVLSIWLGPKAPKARREELLGKAQPPAPEFP